MGTFCRMNVSRIHVYVRQYVVDLNLGIICIWLNLMPGSYTEYKYSMLGFRTLALPYTSKAMVPNTVNSGIFARVNCHENKTLAKWQKSLYRVHVLNQM